MIKEKLDFKNCKEGELEPLYLDGKYWLPRYGLLFEPEESDIFIKDKSISIMNILLYNKDDGCEVRCVAYYVRYEKIYKAIELFTDYKLVNNFNEFESMLANFNNNLLEENASKVANIIMKDILGEDIYNDYQKWKKEKGLDFENKPTLNNLNIHSWKYNEEGEQ